MSTNRNSNRMGIVVPAKKRTATIHLVQSSRLARRLAKLLIVGLALSVIAMAFLPWQQTSRGTGEVVAFAPQERRQTVQSTAKGIVKKIADGLVDGKQVKKGEILLEIQPFAGDMVQQLEGQLSELEAKQKAAKIKSEAYQANVTGFTEILDFAVSAAEEMVASAEAKLQSKQKQISAYQAKRLQARLNYERQEGLWRKGLKPQKEVEKLKKEWDVAQADFESVNRDVTSLERELQAKRDQLQEKRREAQTKVEYAVAMKQGALGEMATARKEMGDLRMKLQQAERLTIRAPRDGTVFRLNVNELGDTVKEGDSLMTIIPEASQKAVAILIRGNDMPLVQKGQEVRLQFEGWPAVQVPGWPSIAWGVFSGKVATIDATDNGKGEFRILVIPNEEDREWPSDRYTRQGARANGWVMLRSVPLGYEIWRQLNGFPVILSDKESDKGKVKKPKLPK